MELGTHMAVQYTYVMKGLTKTFPGAAKPVLNNIHLQFIPSAKIAISTITPTVRTGGAHVASHRCQGKTAAYDVRRACPPWLQ